MAGTGDPQESRKVPGGGKETRSEGREILRPQEWTTMEMQEEGGLFKGVVSEEAGNWGWAGGAAGLGLGGGPGQSSGRKSRALPLGV